MILKKIFDLENQTNIYGTEDDEGVFVPQEDTNRFSITVRFRTRRCNTHLRHFSSNFDEKVLFAEFL